MPEQIGRSSMSERTQSSVATIAALHAEHFERSPPLQQFVERLTRRAGRPAFVLWLTIAVVGWVSLNALMGLTGHKPFDAPPFAGMEVVVSLAALYTTLFVLVTQRREHQLATRREQLTLELAILNEQKSAKVIELLEELRREHPMLESRVDRDAAEMATPADPQAIFEAISARHDDNDVGGG